MSRLVLLGILVMGILVIRTSSHGFRLKGWLSGYRHHSASSRHGGHHVHDHNCNHGGEEEWLKEYGGPYENNDCACLLYAERELVFVRLDTAWYSCTSWGLFRCGEYCDTLLADEHVRKRSRQNACDVLNREVNTTWYRRHQVCGAYGPYEDYQMSEHLCCYRGRPWDHC